MPKRPDPPRHWRSVFYPPPNYPYFERAPLFGSSPTIGKLNMLKAAWMADAAALAYARSGAEPIPVKRLRELLEAAGFIDCDLFGDWSGGPKGTQAYFAHTKEFAILAFRGTERDDWRDGLRGIGMLGGRPKEGGGFRYGFDPDQLARLIVPKTGGSKVGKSRRLILSSSARDAPRPLTCRAAWPAPNRDSRSSTS